MTRAWNRGPDSPAPTASDYLWASNICNQLDNTPSANSPPPPNQVYIGCTLISYFYRTGQWTLYVPGYSADFKVYRHEGVDAQVDSPGSRFPG